MLRGPNALDEHLQGESSPETEPGALAAPPSALTSSAEMLLTQPPSLASAFKRCGLNVRNMQAKAPLLRPGQGDGGGRVF